MGKAARSASIILPEEGVRIPGDLVDLAAFRRWFQSSDFPGKGRIDWIEGELEVDLSPEELNSHATPKAAIARYLGNHIEENDLGVVVVDSTRLTCTTADLSVEPDVVVVLFDSLDRGAVRLVPSGGEQDRCVEIQGVPDLVVECVSQSSVAKDCVRLKERYAVAGIPEYWIADARRETPVLKVYRRVARRYREVKPDREGYTRSACLGRRVRLEARPARSGVVRYRLLLGD